MNNYTNNVGGAYTVYIHSSDSDTCIYKNVQCRNISVMSYILRQST